MFNIIYILVFQTVRAEKIFVYLYWTLLRIDPLFIKTCEFLFEPMSKYCHNVKAYLSSVSTNMH